MRLFPRKWVTLCGLAGPLAVTTPIAAHAGTGFFDFFKSPSPFAECTRLENPPSVKIEKCTEFLGSASATSPTDRAQALTERGIARRMNESSEPSRLASIDDFTSAIAADPGFARAYLQRGRAADGWKTDERQRAIEDFAAAMRLDPSNAEARLMHESWSGTADRVPIVAASQGAALVPTIGHASDVMAAVFSQDGRTLYSGDRDGVVKVWDVPSGRLIRTLGVSQVGGLVIASTGGGEVGGLGWAAQLAVSPSQDALVVGNSLGRVRLWAPKTGALLQEFNTPRCGSCPVDTPVAMSPNGQILAGSYDGKVRWLSTSSPEASESLQAHSPSGDNAGVDAIAVSADGKQLATSGVEDAQGSLILWRRQGAGWAVQRKLDDRSIIKRLAFLQGGKQLLATSGTTLKLWDVASGRLVRSFDGHAQEVASFAVSPDGRTFYSIDQGTGSMSDDSKSGAVIRWDLATGQSRTLSPLGARGAAIYGNEGIAAAPDGRTIVVTGAEVLQLDAETGALIRTFGSQHDGGRHVHFVGANKEFVVNGMTAIRQFDAVTGRLVRTYAPTGISQVMLTASADGRYVAAVGVDKKTRLFEAGTGQLLREFGPAAAYRGRVRFTPDGKRLAVAGGLRLETWQVPGGEAAGALDSPGAPFTIDDFVFTGAGEQIFIAHSGSYIGSIGDIETGKGQKIPEIYIQQFERVTMAGGGKLAVAGNIDGAVVFYETKTWHPVKESRIQKDDIRALTSSADGSKVIAAGYQGTISHVDGNTGELVRTFSGEFPSIESLSLSGDETRIVSGGSDGVARVWDVESGALLSSFLATPEGEWLVITPEGYFNASSPKAAELLSIVRGTDVGSIDQVYQALYRPDLVREKLAGDTEGLVKAAAAKLDLDKVMASGTAPAVEIVSPLPGSTTQTLTINIEVKIIDQGAGVGRIEWRVNGVTQGQVGKRGLARTDGSIAAAGKTATLTETLSLEPGENTIEVVAYNGANLIASQPAAVKVTLAAPEANKPRLFVLAIGVNDYFDSRMRLAFAVPDAKRLASALETAAAGHYESAETILLTDENVTREKLEATFKSLGQRMRPSDVLIFFAAGHGVTRDGRYYFLPRDFRYQTEASIAENGIGQDLWQSWFALLPARKSMLLYDTCESGTLTAPGVQQIAMRSGLEQQAAVGRLIQATGRTVLTASTSDKPALEGYKGHGVFTFALLDALANADRNANALIEVTELAAFVDQKVPLITEKAFGLRQVPQMSIQGSDFPIAKRIDASSQTGDESVPESVPSNPTHVVLEAVDVFAEAGGRGAVVLKLKAASSFAVVRSEKGWSLIARDGKAIGYIPEKKAARLQ